MKERAWYIRQIISHNWSKKVLIDNIKNTIRLSEALDDSTTLCYTDNNIDSIENTVCRPSAHPKTVAEMMNTLSSQECNCFIKMTSQLKNADYDEYDLLIAIEQTDLRDMYHICGGDFAEKMFLLSEFIDRQKDSIKV